MKNVPFLVEIQVSDCCNIVQCYHYNIVNHHKLQGDQVKVGRDT